MKGREKHGTNVEERASRAIVIALAATMTFLVLLDVGVDYLLKQLPS